MKLLGSNLYLVNTTELLSLKQLDKDY